MKRYLFKTFRLLVLSALVVFLSVLAINVVMINKAKDASYSSVSEVPTNDVALVFGSRFKTARGNINPFFYSRMKAAAELYHAKKVKHILVSGDNHSKDYDESTDMKNYLISLGIKSKDITLDYAGFRTLDSVVRCKEIFGVEKITLVSQEFHTPRALFLARAEGIDAIAYNADKVANSERVQFREKLARLKAFIDRYILFKKPKFLGEKEPIRI